MEKTIVLLGYEVWNRKQQNQIQSRNQKFVDENIETLLFCFFRGSVALWQINNLW